MFKKVQKLLRPAIFLDRDGVLTQRHLLTWRKNQLKLTSKIAPFIRFFNKKNIPVIVITNQPVVARGWISEKGVEKLHQILQNRLNKQGAFIDKFYFCPHHPNANLKEYQKKCNCRKPKIGLFKKAAKEFNIDLKKSIGIGDMTQDILAGKQAGIKTILLIKSGYSGKDNKYKIKADFDCQNLSQALKLSKRLIFKLTK
jgi:D-glycero-D-manno-heptose 1,7-bisphosphate phosphatase